MRIARALLASYLLLGLPFSAAAADKVKIEIVEATTTIGLVARTSPGTPEQIRTHCNTRVDVNCTSTVIPATDPSSGLLPEILSFDAKVILPDGSHAELICFPAGNKKCKGIRPIASNAIDSRTGCVMKAIAAFAHSDAAAGNAKSCTTKKLGFYQAKRTGDEVVIYGPAGKLEYRITGSW